MEATGSMPSDIPSMAFPTVTVTGSANATGLNSMGGMPSMTDMPSMAGMMASSCKIDMLWNWYTIDACFLSHSWQIKSRGMFAGSCIGVVCLVLCLEALRRLGREYDALILHRARQRQTRSHEVPPQGSAEPPRTENVIRACCARKDPDSNLDGNGVHPTVAKSPSSQHHHVCSFPEVSNETNPKIAGTQNGVHWPLVTPKPEHISISSRSKSNEIHYRPSPVEQVVRALLHTLQFGVAYIVMLLAMYYNGYMIICIFIGAFLGDLIFSWEEISLDKQ
ncbi:hypothetical protein PENSTE_c003G09642 [Penicillium steckii]|uniref:Copper transport protein n=1 Tax=Penicillium steckii TaxID=303698 RepID=A0A1V6TR88_9EURO|nr:hypothetical protein PENSTE_c003G09642 [Penicillium steckii]